MKKLSQLSSLILLLLLTTAGIQPREVKGPVFVSDTQLPDYTFTDQFGKSHKIKNDTKRLIVALDKEAAHAVTDFLSAQADAYLEDHHTNLIVDVSAAPGIIQKMFILPGLRDFEYPVLIFTDEEEAAPFRMGLNAEKLLEVTLKNKRIVNLKEHAVDSEAVKAMLDQ